MGPGIDHTNESFTFTAIVRSPLLIFPLYGTNRTFPTPIYMTSWCILNAIQRDPVVLIWTESVLRPFQKVFSYGTLQNKLYKCTG